jgi:MFS family permease
MIGGVLRLSLAVFLIQAGFHGFTVSIPLALSRVGRTDAEIGAIVGIAPLVQIPAALIGGALIDRFGGFKLVAVGGVAYLASTAILLLPGVDPATSSVQFVAARVLQGFGFGIVMPAVLSLAPRLVAIDRRGLALASVSASHNLTLVLLPPISILVLDAAGLDGVSLMVAAFVITALTVTFARPFAIRSGDEHAPFKSAKRVLGMAFRRSWLAPLTIILLWVIHWGVIVAYLPQRAELSGANIGLFFAADGLLVLAMRLPAGWMADRVPASWQILAGLAVTALGVALVVPPPTTPLLIISGALTGAGAAFIAVPVTLVLTRRSNEEDRGSAFALFSVFFSAAIAIGSIGAAPLIGTIGYEALLLSTLVAIGIAALITILDRDLGTVPTTHVEPSEPESVATTAAAP